MRNRGWGLRGSFKGFAKFVPSLKSGFSDLVKEQIPDKNPGNNSGEIRDQARRDGIPGFSDVDRAKINGNDIKSGFGGSPEYTRKSTHK
jgi:hypothetical protein